MGAVVSCEERNHYCEERFFPGPAGASSRTPKGSSQSHDPNGKLLKLVWPC